MLTTFQTARQQVAEGKITPPTVGYGEQQIDYFGFQLASHKYWLSVLAIGIKGNMSLKELKAYYGLKGKTAKDCLVEFKELQEKYKAEFNSQPA